MKFVPWALLLLTGVATAAEDAEWNRVELDATFRAEGVAAADFNNDGLVDIAAGDLWYAAPDWTPHEIRQVGEYKFDAGYSQCFASWAWDVNQDGRQDLIIVGFPGESFHWYENPGEAGGHWAAHEIWHSICNETPLFTDLTGDGKPEIVLGSQPEAKLGYLTLPSKENCTDKWVFHPIGSSGDPHMNGTFKYYHGLGVGDLNQDGRKDLVIPHGWWEAPASGDEWTFHDAPLVDPANGEPAKAANIFVTDLDLDGDQDVIGSCAHSYGVWWFENTDGSGDAFTPHVIDKSHSQTHALGFVDIDGDGAEDLVTGKRFYAHQGNDPGGKDPVMMFYYNVTREKGKPPVFTRNEIVAGRSTGIGTQFQIADVDKDGKPDIVLSNKKGVNLLLQK